MVARLRWLKNKRFVKQYYGICEVQYNDIKDQNLSLFDYNHSISNKMISVNPIGELSSWGNLAEAARRKRTPSKYAESIRELTKNGSKNSRKQKNQKSNRDELLPTSSAGQDQDNVLSCILPSRNKTVKLSVIIKKPTKQKMLKISSIASVQRQKEKEKQGIKNSSLLDTLLQVIEQYKVDEQNKKDGGSPKTNQIATLQCQTVKKQTRSRKDKEFQQKYVKFYQRYRNLNDKYETMENDIVII